MFSPENKIIIVDDVQDHLDTLSKPFRENGIGCSSFLYDANYNTPLSTVKIAFFDIGINPGGGGSKNQRLNSIAHAIQQYISPNNGPFVLIFWTNRKDEIDDIKTYIQERYKADYPRPFVIDCIDKDFFLQSEKRLKKKLNTLLSNGTWKMLFSFEEITSKAATKTIGQLFNIIPGTDRWGETKPFQRNFEKVFSRLAVQNIGYKHAKENPDRGVISSLIPVLNHHLESSQETNQWKNYLKTLDRATKQSEVKYPKGFDEDKLNSIFHIHNKQDIPKDERGVVLQVDHNAFEVNFGMQYPIWFSNLLNGVTTQFRNASTLVAVEISSSCDYAQKKIRLNKYMLAVLLPVEALKKIKKDRRPENLFILDGVFSTDKKFKICLNLNFVFSALPTDNKLQTPLFILKKEIMDQIGNRYANHISRIGVTSF